MNLEFNQDDSGKKRVLIDVDQCGTLNSLLKTAKEW